MLIAREKPSHIVAAGLRYDKNMMFISHYCVISRQLTSRHMAGNKLIGAEYLSICDAHQADIVKCGSLEDMGKRYTLFTRPPRRCVSFI